MALTLCSCCKKNRTHRGGLTDAEGSDITLDELHGVVNRQPRRNRSTWAVDVNVDVLVPVVGDQKQDLGDHQIRGVILNSIADEDDPILQQS